MSAVSHTPAPWRVEPHCLKIFADGVRNGPMLVADIRGWGYLTGAGHGALGLSPKEALAIQAANAEFIVRAVNSHRSLVLALNDAYNLMAEHRDFLRDNYSILCAEDPHVGELSAEGKEEIAPWNKVLATAIEAIKLAGAQP